VFLDRDGTVVREVGYLNHPRLVELLPWAGAAIRKLNRAGVLVVLATNQAGVARGIFPESVLRLTLDRMVELLEDCGARLDAIYYSVNHPESSDPRYHNDPNELRKPGIGMIRKAAAELPIDLGRAFVIGDRINDVIFGHKAGLCSLLVKTGMGLGEYEYLRQEWPEQPDLIVDNLMQAVNWVLRRLRMTGPNQ